MNRKLNLTEIEKEVVDTVLELLQDKVYKIVLFGSYARGDFTIESDVDILILLNCSKEETKKSKGNKPSCKQAGTEK